MRRTGFRDLTGVLTLAARPKRLYDQIWKIHSSAFQSCIAMNPEKPDSSLTGDLTSASRPPLWTHGWVWSVLVCPIAYWVTISTVGPESRDAFLYASICVAAVGLLGVLVWKFGPKNETLFQVSSFLFNWFFIAYFISLLTRT